MIGFKILLGSCPMRLSLTVIIIVSLLISFGCGKKDEGVIKIGAVLPMTGDAAKYGTWIAQGMQLAVDEINASGGIQDKELQLTLQDSQTNPNEGVKAMRFLITKVEPIAVFTTLTSVSRALIPIAEEKKVILFANATLPGLTEDGEYVFRNVTNLSSDVQAATDYCIQQKNKPPVAIIWRNDDFGLWGSRRFAELFKKSNGIITTSISYEPETKDFRTHILKIGESKPQIVYLLSYSEAGYIIKQSRELGYKWENLGITTLGDPEVEKIAGSALEGAVFTESRFNPDSGEKLVQEFQQQYRERFKEKAELWSATFYDGVKIFALAANKSDLTPNGIRENLLNIKDYPGVTGLTTFLPNGDVQKPVILKTIKEGQPVILN